jgi:crotonobetainyl-CoA:carnitine CoA-transferase CaiB-like acyl-CoA transferase
MAPPCGPPAGVKVVACSTAQAGTVPYMLMADLGAEVIKIEMPGVGDASRRAGHLPGFPSTYFETNNREGRACPSTGRAQYPHSDTPGLH